MEDVMIYEAEAEKAKQQSEIVFEFGDFIAKLPERDMPMRNLVEPVWCRVSKVSFQGCQILLTSSSISWISIVRFDVNFPFEARAKLLVQARDYPLQPPMLNGSLAMKRGEILDNLLMLEVCPTRRFAVQMIQPAKML
ncbi:Hypothetical predicted protein, partial [Olea europaea subsp. europaea]